MGQRIAVIGGGVAGLTAAYLLRGKYDVTLFEKSERIGGNAYTLTLPDGEEVDIAVAVFGENSSKNLFKLFTRLNIETVHTGTGSCGASGPGMNFYDLDTHKGISMSLGIGALLAQRFKQFLPRHIRSLIRLARGQKRARMLHDAGELDGLTVEQALTSIPQLSGDAKLFFLGGLCLVSSMHGNDVLSAPAAFFIEKQKKHEDIFFPKAFYSTRFTKNRTRAYVDALSSVWKEKIVLRAAIDAVIRHDDHITLVMRDGERLRFDKVVFACNADQALELLKEPTDEERRLMGSWKYTEGRIVVHRDHTQFPRKNLMGGYTFLYREGGGRFESSISGSLWALPGVSKSCDLISTQHPNFPIAQDRIVFEKVFRTPIFDRDSCATIRELPSLNGKNNTYYCGSHFGFGLHEDAVTSAVAIARQLHIDF